MPSVCAIDFGTTRIKAALVGDQGAMLALVSAPTPGASDGDPDRAVDVAALPGAVFGLLRTLGEQAPDASPPEGLCVTGQRATFIARDARGEALATLSWQDPRAADDLAGLRAEIGDEGYQRLTGLPHSPIAVLTRLRWLRRCRPELARATRRLALVTDTVLETLGAPEGVIDPSNASPTGFWDLTKGAWSAPLLRLGELDAAQLPRVAPAGTRVGALSDAAARATGLRAGTPLLLGGGDQPCATLGMGVLEPGQLGLCLGTSADLTSPVVGVAEPRPGRICTRHVVAEQTLLEGFLAAFGAAQDWGRALLPAPPVGPAPDADAAPADAPFFLPFLSGIVTPDFAPTVRAGFLGLQPTHGPATVARAIREGLALELRRVLASAAMPDGLETIIVSGGAQEPALLREIATVLGMPVVALERSEATLLGAACLAWTGLGRYATPTEASRAFGRGRLTRHEPDPADDVRDRRYASYCRWVARLLEGS